MAGCRAICSRTWPPPSRRSARDPAALQATIEKSPSTLAVGDAVVAGAAPVPWRFRRSVAAVAPGACASCRGRCRRSTGRSRSAPRCCPAPSSSASGSRGRCGELEDLFENPNTLLTIRDLQLDPAGHAPGARVHRALPDRLQLLELLHPLPGRALVADLGARRHRAEPGRQARQPVPAEHHREHRVLPQLGRAPGGRSGRSARPAAVPLGRLYTPFYRPAIDAQGNADCETGQDGYVKGPLSKNRYGPGTLARRHAHRRQLPGHRDVPDPRRRHLQVARARHRQPRRTWTSCDEAQAQTHRTARGHVPLHGGRDRDRRDRAWRPSSASRRRTRSPAPTSSRRSSRTPTTSSRTHPCGSPAWTSARSRRSRPTRTARATVKMEIKDKGLPLHEDATLKVRPRIFLEGNFFVDIQPGSPSVADPGGGRPDRAEPDGGAGPVRRPARRAPERHPRRPPGLPQGVREGHRGQGRGGLQPVPPQRGRGVPEPRHREPGRAGRRSRRRTYSGC